MPPSQLNAPVHNLQILYLSKLFGVIRNEGHAKRVSVRAYQHVHGSDGLPCSFELCTYRPVFLGRLFIEVRDFKRENELIKSLLVLFDVLAFGHTITKFRKGYGRNTDIADSMRFKMFKHFGGILFDEVNAD